MTVFDEKATGLVFNTQRFSLHDGPGIRTLIFMKGCPLRCVWCANPESQSALSELGFIPDRCIGWGECGLCIDACPYGAVRKESNGKIEIERDLCTHCGVCAQKCPSRALKMFGEYMSLDAVIDIVHKDGDFYSRSGGGVTVGGGEPLSQASFVSSLLEKLKRQGIDTAVETCGYGEFEDLEKMCRHANVIFFDIKHMNSIHHKAYTGVGNELILENLKKLSDSLPDIPIVVRTPVVPGFNDSEENIRATADFLTGIGNLKKYELLPYHGFGEPKYRQLGKVYSLRNLDPPSKESLIKLKWIGDTRLRKRDLSQGSCPK